MVGPEPPQATLAVFTDLVGAQARLVAVHFGSIVLAIDRVVHLRGEKARALYRKAGLAGRSELAAFFFWICCFPVTSLRDPARRLYSRGESWRC